MGTFSCFASPRTSLPLVRPSWAGFLWVLWFDILTLSPIQGFLVLAYCFFFFVLFFFFLFCFLFVFFVFFLFLFFFFVFWFFCLFLLQNFLPADPIPYWPER